jgi:hypothetical protein
MHDVRLLTASMVSLVLCASAHAAYDVAVLSDNPAAYWRMNETSGTSAADSSGNGNTGTYFNGVTLGVPGGLVATPSNTAARYDGASDGMGSPTPGVTDHMDASVTGLGTNYSMEFWFRNTRPITGPGSLPIAGYIVGRGSGGGLAYDTIGIWGTAGFPFGRLYVFSGQGFVQDGTSTPTVVNTWYHVGMTRNGSTVELYLNGNLEMSGTLAPTFGASTQFTAGYRPDTGWPYMGDIDEFAVYNTVLTGADFMQHYLASIPEPSSAMLLLVSASAAVIRRSKFGALIDRRA